jgi:hypothetical protein
MLQSEMFAFKQGDKVVVDLGSAGVIRDCTIVNAHYSVGAKTARVDYDIDVQMVPDENNLYSHTRIYKVSASFVSKP